MRKRTMMMISNKCNSKMRAKRMQGDRKKLRMKIRRWKRKKLKSRRR